MTTPTKLPASEFRRTYVRELVSQIQRLHGVSIKEARSVVENFITVIQRQVHAGKPVDLGFLIIKPVTKAPKTVRYNLDAQNGGKAELHGATFCIGEHAAWKVGIRESWEKKYSPNWSRY